MPLIAPWTNDEVASLNAYQSSMDYHPFTGRDESGKKVVLIATPSGWVTSPGGPIVQDWAHGWMANWSWKS
jgi:hypothetical protein